MSELLHVKAITVEHYNIFGVETKMVHSETDLSGEINRWLEIIRAQADSDEKQEKREQALKGNFEYKETPTDIVVYEISPMGLHDALIVFGYAVELIIT